LVEIVPGKVSGAPLLKNTRLPVEAITGNYDAFRDEGLSPEAAIAETFDCYPEAGLHAIKAILNYRDGVNLSASQLAELDHHLATLDQDRRGGIAWTALKAELEERSTQAPTQLP